MRVFRFLSLSLLTAAYLLTEPASAALCDYIKEQCPSAGGSSTKPAYPSKSSSINLNPAAVPTERGLGLEILQYSGDFDFSFVTGTGRIGAALSPSNSEETFFGPLGFEIEPDYLTRKQEGRKYTSQKTTLATGFSLWQNGKKGLRRVQLNLGVLGRYNRVSGSLLAGAGVSGVAGPFTFGYSKAEDEYLLDYTQYGIEEPQKFQYKTETLSAGVFLNSLAIDVSKLMIYASGYQTMTITLVTASLMLKRMILTGAYRREDSERSAYNFDTKELEERWSKREYFGGIQLAGTPRVLIGCFYNYYLLHDISIGLTVFF